MADDEPPSESSYLSPSDLRSWLVEEVKNTTKELQLRLAEAASFVTAYGLGELTPEEATERYHRYQHRWFQPLDGHQASFFHSDEDLLARIDTTRGRYFTLREDEEYRKKSSERLRNRGGEHTR